MLFIQSQAIAVYISARYPVTDPPFAVSAGGLQVMLIKLQPPVKFECKTGWYGTSIKLRKKIAKHAVHVYYKLQNTNDLNDLVIYNKIYIIYETCNFRMYSLSNRPLSKDILSVNYTQ